MRMTTRPLSETASEEPSDWMAHSIRALILGHFLLNSVSCFGDFQRQLMAIGSFHLLFWVFFNSCACSCFKIGFFSTPGCFYRPWQEGGSGGFELQGISRHPKSAPPTSTSAPRSTWKQAKQRQSQPPEPPFQRLQPGSYFHFHFLGLWWYPVGISFLFFPEPTATSACHITRYGIPWCAVIVLVGVRPAT